MPRPRRVRLWLKADIMGYEFLCPLLPRKRTFRGFLKITFLNSGEMSAFGGKADIIHGMAKGPLLAKSGHSGNAVWLVKGVRICLFASGKAGCTPIRFPCNRGERFVEFSPLGMLL